MLIIQSVQESKPSAQVSCSQDIDSSTRLSRLAETGFVAVTDNNLEPAHAYDLIGPRLPMQMIRFESNGEKLKPMIQLLTLHFSLSDISMYKMIYSDMPYDDLKVCFFC